MRPEPAPTVLATFIAIGLIAGCGKGPTKPIDPTPTPTPIASATPRPRMAPLIVTAGGEFIPPLLGATTCCDDPATMIDEGVSTGWPMVDSPTLDLYAESSINLTEIRLGPNNGDGGDPGPDESLILAEETLLKAEARGVYVLVGLIDAWPMKHGLNYWGDDCSVMHHPPQQRHLDWVDRVVRTLAHHPNVVFFDGNETFQCRPSEDWVTGLYARAKQQGARLVGSNSQGVASLDFEVIHGFRAPGVGQILAESDNRNHSVDDWLALERRSQGVVMFWRGPMSFDEWERLLRAAR